MPEAVQRRAEYFELTPNVYPAKQDLDGLKDVKARAQVRTRLVRAELGNYGDHRRLDGDLLELREDKGPGYRVYLGEEGTKLILILAVGDKSGQDKDIKRAREYWAMHKSRKRRPGHAT
jgi:putative addiction module killer protein